MEMKFEIIGNKQLEIGDIFYCTPNQELNEFGPDAFITGTDQILIMDDSDEDDEGNYGVLVNGGRTVWFKTGQKVVRLAHYRDMMRVIEMVQEGNPDMEVGPNDSGTLIENMIAEYPDMQVDLLAGLGDDLFDDKESDNDKESNNDKEIDDEDLSDLPF